FVDLAQEKVGRYRARDDLARESRPRAQGIAARSSSRCARLDGGRGASVAPALRAAALGRRVALAKKPTNPPAQPDPKGIGSRTGPAAAPRVWLAHVRPRRARQRRIRDVSLHSPPLARTVRQ